MPGTAIATNRVKPHGLTIVAREDKPLELRDGTIVTPDRKVKLTVFNPDGLPVVRKFPRKPA